MQSEILFGTIRDLAQRIKKRELSSTRLVDDQLARIEALNPILNVYITLLKDQARHAAEEADEAIRENKYLGPLHGVPLAMKDIMTIQNVRCTAGSKILSDYIASEDATTVKKLKNAGGILLGTLNLHEFGSGVTNVNQFFGTVYNPWALDRISGGSSGGSAAAVAAGLAFATLGTDTSGSVRIPASLCGVFGLKPTYGLISKHGVIPLSKSLDHVGILARSSWDIAAVLDAIAGFDPQDPASAMLPNRASYVDALESQADLPPFRVGIPRQYFLDYLDPEVKDIFSAFLDRLTELGFSVIDIEVGKLDRVYDTWAAIRLGEAAAFHHNWFVSRRKDYGEDVAQRLAKGETITAVQYINALETKTEIGASFAQAFKKVDLIVVPTTPVTAPRIGEEKIRVGGVDFDTYGILSRLTIPFNVAGIPALTVPVGLSKLGLPISAQLVAEPYREGLILKSGFAYETKFGGFKPPKSLAV
jgi:aspartyl-tRNA(Asn)/glutamyl-tRNA(Gln) amidotransferase subunit A